MNNLILVILTVLFYIGALGLQVIQWFRRNTLLLFAFYLLGGLGCLTQAILLYHLIDVQHLQNLSVVNLFSLVAWLAAVIVLFATFQSPLANLGFLVFPLAIFSVILAVVFPGKNLLNTAQHPDELFHILLSTLTFSVLCIAALQAALLGVQEWLLRHKRASRVIRILPPLEVMEIFLFRWLRWGFILLTLVLLSSWWLFHPLFTQALWQKTVLTLFAWIIFAGLLAGHSYLGWRGRLAIRYTLFGVFLVMLIYYGSKLI